MPFQLDRNSIYLTQFFGKNWLRIGVTTRGNLYLHKQTTQIIRVSTRGTYIEFLENLWRPKAAILQNMRSHIFRTNNVRRMKLMQKTEIWAILQHVDKYLE